jgi:hypothetical protein
VLSKRVPILGEGIACNQDPDSLHCKALKRAKSLGELKIVIGNYYSFDFDIYPNSSEIVGLLVFPSHFLHPRLLRLRQNGE